MTKLTDRPAYCASCYASYDDVRYVDFGAAYDGPVLEGSIKITIDDLVMCEQCLKEGFDVLKLGGAGAHVETLEAEIERLNKKVRHLERYQEGLEDAISYRPEPIRRKARV